MAISVFRYLFNLDVFEGTFFRFVFLLNGFFVEVVFIFRYFAVYIGSGEGRSLGFLFFS